MNLTEILLTDRTTDELLDIDIRRVIPRHTKARDAQKKRTKNTAEVFTPSWVCNAQNNLIDGAWFEKDGVFNTESEKSWKTNPDKVKFPDGKDWKDYIGNNVLEITCGEAPYLVSRYDTVSGEPISVPDRIGLLDRKLRVLSENASSEEEWLSYSLDAVMSTYGYEYQQDSLWLARKNIVQSVKEHFYYRYGHRMPSEEVAKIAYVASWNIFQMDGLKAVIPNTCSPDCKGCKKKGLDGIHLHDGRYAKIMNWITHEPEEFREQMEDHSKPMQKSLFD